MNTLYTPRWLARVLERNQTITTRPFMAERMISARKRWLVDETEDERRRREERDMAKGAVK